MPLTSDRRTNEGINLAFLFEKYDRDLRKEFGSFLDRCVKDKLAYFNNDNFILTEAGFFLSDAIILELMN